MNSLSHPPRLAARKALPSQLLTVALLVPLMTFGCGPGSEVASAQPSLDLPGERPLRVGFLVVDGVYNTELMAPWDVFQHTTHHAAPRPGLDVFAVSPDGGTITTAEGLRLEPRFGFDDSPEIDILVVPSAEGSRDRNLEDSRIIDWVAANGARARFVVSLCWGAFVLAEAGLLDGHQCTTFPSSYPEFARRFPELDLQVNVSFVHQGRVITSQGGIRSYDAAMYLVDLLYGEEVAQRVGSGLLIPWPPDPRLSPPHIGDPALQLERQSP